MNPYKCRFVSTLIFIVVIILSSHLRANDKKNGALFKRDINFNDDWKFKRCEPAENTIEIFKEIDYDDAAWETVSLPHTPRIEPLVVNDQWQGICWYRKSFALESFHRGRKIFIEFEAAMQIAEVWVNGKHKITHYGGYLPFTIDITNEVFFDKKNLIAVRLDNRDNPEVPPGKPLKELDFCMYGGLYRNVKMHITDKLHITDAVYANQAAGGGIFVQYPLVKKDLAQIWIQTHVINENDETKTFKVVSRLFDDKNKLIAEKASTEIGLESLEDKHVVQTMEVRRPKLWHPNSPDLYALHSLVFQDGKLVDRVVTRIGIRHISFSATEGFKINGEKFYLRGTNRHQEYPYLGYALSNNAHYRDALKIKQAGFDFVRLSHYPHAEAFMNACDELGILVMDSIPGWQFFGNDIFQQRSFQDCRDMIRRDRNHPSVILWEVSLNESGMTKAFMEKAHRIAHEEYPGDQCHTCGWQDYAYDVFIPARQHAKAPDYWKKYSKSKPLFIAEYGDWEYYAQDAGFNQAQFKNLSPDERNSRQLRSHGEKRLLQQALNYQEAFDDNLASPAAGCANWLIFDYNRGYADDIEASGIMDIFRIPKFAYYFFKSQRPPEASPNHQTAASPTLFIADHWMENSDLSVKIFSNCQTVTLLSNGKKIATQNSDRDAYSKNLRYPPFTFKMDGFQAGALEAIGLIGGKPVASHKVKTSLEPHRLRLTDGCDGVEPQAGNKDVIFVYASVVDENGTLVPTAANTVTFALSGPARLIGQNPMAAEAGIASILVETQGEEGIVEITAASPGLPVLKRIAIKVDRRMDTVD
jgi:beta-galactosidase